MALRCWKQRPENKRKSSSQLAISHIQLKSPDSVHAPISDRAGRSLLVPCWSSELSSAFFHMAAFHSWKQNMLPISRKLPKRLLQSTLPQSHKDRISFRLVGKSSPLPPQPVVFFRFAHPRHTLPVVFLLPLRPTPAPFPCFWKQVEPPVKLCTPPPPPGHCLSAHAPHRWPVLLCISVTPEVISKTTLCSALTLPPCVASTHFIIEPLLHPLLCWHLPLPSTGPLL